jgi:hypothetical protein
MPPPSADLITEQQKLSENIQKNKTAAKSIFPNEQWVDAKLIKMVQEGTDFEIPDGIDNIKIAKSRITPSKNHSSISDNDARTLAKEIRQAKVLTDRGASVFILPKNKGPDGREISGPDALVNGILYEFKTVTGSIDKVERRFRQSRDQGQNVFIRIMNPGITRSDVIRKMYSVVNDRKYTGGLEGNLIFSVRIGHFDHLSYVRIRDFKK